MDYSFFENQINKRRRYDDEMFKDAFSDLLSILGIDGPKAVTQAKTALTQILKYLNLPIPEIPENVTEVEAQLEYMLKPSGTMKRRVELLGEWWKDCTGCLLGSTKDGNVVAIIPSKWSGYEYRDTNGKIVKVNKETAKNLNVDAFCFYRSFPMKKLKIKDLLVFMFKSLSRMDIVFILSATLIVQLLAMLTPYTNQIIMNILIPSGSKSLIAPVASLLMGIAVGSSLIKVTQSIILNRFSSKLNLSVNSALMIRIFNLPVNFFKEYNSAELANRMGYITQLCQLLANAILSTGLSTVFSLGFIFQMHQYAPTLVVPGMIIISVTILFLVLGTIVKQQINKKSIELTPKLSALTHSLFGGIQKIKVAGAEKRAFAKWAEQYSEVEKLTYSPPMFLKSYSVISTVISSLGMIAIYYVAATSKVPIANYTSFYSAYGSVASALLTLSNVALNIANLGPILDMIKPIMEAEPEIDDGRKIVTSLSGNIEVNNVTFRYGDGPVILNDISLKIKKGEYVAIVGKTGCGKSTLLRLLLGFETPEKGGIYYNGRDLNTLDLRSVRQKIGVVMQNGSLFPGDIFSNIVVTAPWKTLNDAWEAAKLAGIDEDIKAMPMNMSTLISEGAGGISGGQKQRIMIARAIIGKPSILFFDEATSALDNITQSHVANSIASLNCTRLVIAHRVSTIKHCDRIIVLDDGKIAEEGNYEELMSKKGIFYELAIRQVAE